MTRLRGLVATPMRLWVAATLAAYLLLVAFGATTSSIGVPPLRDDPSEGAPGLIGGPDSIRSDEFLRTTPWRIGLLASGDDSFGTPLSYPDPALVTNGDGGLVTGVLFPDTMLLTTVGGLLPAQAFAAVWWLPVALVVLLLPLWFRRFGVGLRVSGPVTALVVLSPVSVWWSWGALAGLGWALLAAEAAASGIRRWHEEGRGWRPAALMLVAGLAMARLALSYQPWAIPLGAAVLVPTLVALLQRRLARARTVLLAAAVVAVALVAVAGFIAEHRQGVSVLSDTVYPGTRRFSGSLRSLAELFAAPHLWTLWRNPPLNGTNQSEVSSGYTVLAAACLALVPAIDWAKARPLRPVVLASGGVFVALASWCTIDWPEPASHLFPMSLVSPGRLVQVLGLSATLTFGLLLAAWARAPLGRRLPVALTAAAIAFFATAAGGSALRQLNMPTLRTVYIGAAALLTAAAIGFAVASAGRRWALAPAVVLAVPVVALVNPVQFGFADLRSGEAAAEVVAATEDMSPGERWANDDLFVDALLMANAAPSLSGQQWVGPQEELWQQLDPRGRYREQWNRGASYVLFAWEPPGSPTTVELPSPDLILVRTDPCNAGLERLRLGLVASSHPLAGPCLEPRSRFDFGGKARWVYEVDGS